MQMSKYAYLIIAHNEFAILEKLVACLDDERNDIFIHFDRKVRQIPNITAYKSSLFILNNRIDNRWGDFSQLKTEYELFQSAFSNSYSRYILLSGVHLPLMSQDAIHEWFKEREDMEIMASVPNSYRQTEIKMHRYNFFTRWFGTSITAQRLWRISSKLQEVLGIRRNVKEEYYISSQWVALTNKGINCLLENKTKILKEYQFSFCGDEFFVRSSLMKYAPSLPILIEDKLLYVDFQGKVSPRVLTINDYESIIASGCIFARKFSSKQIDVVNRIADYVIE